MTGAVVVLALCWGVEDSPSLGREQRAAMIAYLRHREYQHGKYPEWQGPLRSLRAEVVDALFAQPPTPDWVHRTQEFVLYAFPVLLLLTVVGGAYLVRRNWRRHRLTRAAAWCVVWFAALLALYFAVRPDRGPAAVVRQDGVVLRQGNGLSYPPHVHQGLPVRLAAGVEGVVRVRRPNGWVQVELSTGAVGWVPQDAVYFVEWRP